MTDKQIAKEEALDLNDEDDKKELEVLLSGLDQRDHPVKAWADLGKKQYKYFQDSTASTTKSSERHTWMESACGKEAQPKAKAVLTCFTWTEPPVFKGKYGPQSTSLKEKHLHTTRKKTGFYLQIFKGSNPSYPLKKPIYKGS